MTYGKRLGGNENGKLDQHFVDTTLEIEEVATYIM